MIREQERNGTPGLPMVALFLGIAAVVVWLFVTFVRGADVGNPEPIRLIGSFVLFGINLLVMRGFFMVAPNEARVLQFFGDYAGTAKAPGLRWSNPFYTRKKISLRVRNFESGKLKVNDADGNPIEIAAVVVWRVVETAEATFEVDDYQNYVRVQTESALRNAATSYPYDAHEEAVVSLRGNTAVVADHLQKEVQGRLNKAGVEAMEARISHLAYAPEIAAAMLQRQQAGAIIAARSRIVEGAVGMVEMALQMLSHKGIVTLDEERKAAMVSNLLVVLCGERGAQPIVNTGTIHQ
jgi:regulator of protease activity HflC (stomatin/prohibitin superfamily)